MQYPIMESSDANGCPVCWRRFGSELLPMAVPCGHTVCAECIPMLRQCPLCRRRFTPGAQRSVNYALLSVLDASDNIIKPETQEMTTQTENQAYSSARTDIPQADLPSNLTSSRQRTRAQPAKPKPAVLKFKLPHPTGYHSVELKFS